MNTIRVLLLGDLFGKPGVKLFERHIESIRKQYRVDATIVNGENTAFQNGMGITPDVMDIFKKYRVDVVTSGNHIFDKKEIYSYFSNNSDLIRPANLPNASPGKGFTTFICKGYLVAVINIMGRVFMSQQVDCPFRTIDSILTYLSQKTPIILIDHHAEATSEKLALGYYFDGKVSGVVGTHTHVQTNDARILPGGTAYITDLGMGGALNSMIGVKKELILQKMLTQMPVKYEVATEPPYVLSGVIIEIETTTGKSQSIETLYLVDHESL